MGKAFNITEDPFQIGEGTEHGVKSFKQESSYDFSSDTTSFSSLFSMDMSDKQKVRGSEKVSSSDDVNMKFNKFSIDNLSSRNGTDKRGAISGKLENQFRDRNHGVIHREDKH